MKDVLIQRGETWSYVCSVRNPATGKRRAQSNGGFATKADAKAARNEARGRRAGGVPPSRLRSSQCPIS